ncbi:MAG: PAS domain S-box protein [Deltaproteobacteria bacterium]|nr:PAS domain S-box protein [Deltaproteobacteria bacterium]
MKNNQVKSPGSVSKSFFGAAIPLLLLLTLVIGGAGYLVFLYQKKSIKKYIHKELTAVADLKVAQIAGWRSEKKDDAVVAGKDSFLALAVEHWLLDGAPLDENRSRLLRRLNIVQQTYRYHNIYVIDPKQAIRLSSRPDNEPVGDLSLKLISEVFKSGNAVFSPLQRIKHGPDQKIFIDLLSPLTVTDEAGSRIVGVLLFRIDPALFLYPLIQSWPTPSNTAETQLISRQGENVVYLNELRFRKNVALNLKLPATEEQLPAAMVVRGIEGAVEGIDYRGVPVLAALRRVPDSPWFMVAKMDQAEAYAAIRERAWWMTGFTLMIIVMGNMWVLTWWRRQSLTALRRIEWLMTKDVAPESKPSELDPAYARLDELNTSRLLSGAVGKDIIFETVSDYLKLLGTSSAIMEKNGDYALSPVSSGWCRLLDQASRRLCGPVGDAEALNSGRWHCHESCWTESAKVCIETGQPVDIECRGGIRIYGVPIWAGTEVAGAINFGYGDPPRDPEKLREISSRYNVDMEELRSAARRYETRPPFIIAVAKDRLLNSAKLLGTMVERKRAEESFRILCEQSLQGIAIFQGNPSRIVFVNPKWTEIFGYTTDEARSLSGDDKWKLVHPDDREMVRQYYRDRRSDGKLIPNYQFRIMRKDDAVRWVEVFAGRADYRGEISIQAVYIDITDRKQAEDALLQSEERYRLLFDHAPIGIVHFDHKGVQLASNQKFADIMGVPRERIIGFNALEKIQDQHMLQAVKDALAGKSGYYEGNYLSITSGKMTPIRAVFQQLPCDDGAFYGAMGIFEDVTSQKEAEQALAAEKKRLAVTLNSIGDGVIGTDLAGNVTVLNRVAENMTGWTEEESIGRPLTQVFHIVNEITREVCEDPVSKVLKSCRIITLANHTVLIGKNGKEMIIADSAAPILDENGVLLGVVLVFRDTTDRKLAEIALHNKTEELDRFFSLIVDLLCIADTQGFFRRVNPAWEKSLGYSREELEGRKFLDFVHPEDIESTLGAMDRLSAQEEIYDFVNRYRCKDGSYRWIEWRSSPDSTGLIYAAARDITDRRRAEKDRKKLERQLRQAQKMEAIGTLAGGIAHDFNNILGSIFGYTQLALDDAKSGEVNPAFLEEILKAGKRARDLVKQILTISRQAEQEKKPFEITSILRESIKLIRASLPANIIIEQEISAKELNILGDPTQIHQVLINLCTNAAHSMPESGGILSIKLCELFLDADSAARYINLQPGQYLKLTVSDTGQGMDSALLERIFDPFFTTKELGKGTGMGLAIVHGIVNNHGGAINVYSVPGQGSAFNILLPTIQDRPESPDNYSETIPRGTETILLVDDEPGLLDTGKKILERLGYQVTAETSGVDALGAFMAQPAHFDLIITDMAMPYMTGDKLAREILGLRPNIPIILCTGFSDAVNEDRARDLGVRGFLLKPIDMMVLAKLIRQVLEGR